MRNDFGWGYSGFAHVFGFIVYGFVALLSVAVTVAVIFFLVRFLIYGTKAAQLYIAKNTPAKPEAPAAAAHAPKSADPVTPAAAPASAPASAPAATVSEPVAPVVAPKATPPITPPATKKPPVKKTPNPPVA